MDSASSGLVALGVLTGDFSYASTLASTTPTVETKAQRQARAAFTTKETTPPWKVSSTATQSADTKLAAIKVLNTIIDKPNSADTSISPDVSTSFVTYKALDRLQTIAERASADTTSSAERATLQKTFAKGLADLRTYLGSAPSDLVDISFGKSVTYTQSVAIAAPSSLTAPTINGKGVVEQRVGTLPGVTGTEKLRIDLSQSSGVKDSITIDLSTTPQPPTLDSISDAVNAAIKAIPQRNADGTVRNDEDGNPVPRWAVSLEPVKTGDKWGLSVKRAGYETISIDQIDAPDAVMVAAGASTPVVAKDGTTTPGAIQARLARLDDPDGTLTRTTLGAIGAVDRLATDRAAASSEKTTGPVAASLTTRAMVTDAQGFSYMVGTTAGDLGGNRSDGANDAVLTKVDSEGNMVWQRTLGTAGSAEGAAITIGPDGSIVVATNVAGSYVETSAAGVSVPVSTDGDLLVARFDTQGEEKSETLIRQFGTDTATAIAVGGDGQIYIGGRSSSNGGDAYIARLGTDGKLAERRNIDAGGSETVRSLAIAGDGNLLALTSENGNGVLRSLNASALTTEVKKLDLGQVDVRALAVASDGSIAVGGARSNATTGRDGFVARIDSGLAGATMTDFKTSGDDQVDSLSFLGTNLYAGGRTTGTLGTEKTGTVDAFVARIDATTGTVGKVEQYGQLDYTNEAVQVSAVSGGDSVLGALGLHRGTQTPTDGVSLEAQTTLRAGDEFSIKVNGGRAQKITIAKGDTLTTLASKIKAIVGTRVGNVTTPFKDGERSLRIDLKPGQEIELVAGATSLNALPKLGLEARRIAAPAAVDDDAPKVQPGGRFGLDLNDALSVDTKDGAKLALKQISSAVSVSQSAYRSLYWDDTKAMLANGPSKTGKTGGSTAVEKAQLANYQAALTRLTATSSSSTTTSALIGF